MRTFPRRLAALAIPLLIIGCDSEQPTAPEEGLDLPVALDALGDPSKPDVVIIGGSTLNTTVSGALAYCGSGGSYYTDANTMSYTGGGCLPVVTGELANFDFFPLSHTAVNGAALAPYDIAVLNLATYQMQCRTQNFTAQQKQDLVNFVASGKKLIIYDSECYVPGGVDYSWLPFPFSTANPGALGQPGSLTIVEENTLSTSTSTDPFYINAPYLGSSTDAVGDMNVMTTLDANWCLDMSGTNAINVSGPVHTYAKYPVGSDHGLFIYNGLDMDYLYYGDAVLTKLWVQELKQPVDPSGLPCGRTVVGINLVPDGVTNEVGEDHTVTATLTDVIGTPQEGISVTFTVVSGPNASLTAVGTTDANGEVSFTYTGSGGEGTDGIQACFTNDQGTEVCSQTVTKEWEIINTPPTCGPVSISADVEAVNTMVYASATFTDPDVGDSWSAVWDWGDDQTSAGTVGTGTVGPDGHAYDTPGIYEIGLTVTDSYGETCTAELPYGGSPYIVVYDPSAGFVTGGGRIDSPQGAYKPDPSLIGNATFGFVAKYKKGATTPDGNTEFQFHTGDLNFHSSSYDFLVVTQGGHYAQFKGSGTVNGALAPNDTEYRFIIWAGDDDPDTFRIRIWWEDEGTATEYDVYDNGFDQSLAGGSIVIHTK